MKDKVNFIFDTETNAFSNCSVLSLSFIICQNHNIIKEETRYYFSKEKYNYHATKVHGLTKEVIEEIINLLLDKIKQQKGNKNGKIYTI